MNIPPTNAEKDYDLSNGPPFDSRVCRFASISVNTFSNDEVCLFVLDELKTSTEVPDFLFNRCNLFIIAHVKLAVDVE